MAERLRIIFMGTPDFAVPALEALIDNGQDVVAVYTQPPRPKGRGHKMQPSPVHNVAQSHNIPVHTPVSLKKDTDARAEFSAYDADIAVVAAYGLILPIDILDAPRFGCLNIHASLLPRWRGAAPIQYAIWKGDDQTGISIMQMEEGLDSGPVIETRAVAIRPQSTAQSIHDELAALGAAMIGDIVSGIAREKRKPEAEPQDDSLSTYAPILTKDSGRIDWSQTAKDIDRQIRALNPWPGVWTFMPDEKRLKIIEAEPVSEQSAAPPGTLLDRSGHVSCGEDTTMRLLTVQPENAKKMDVIAAINGHYLHIDDVLG